MSADSLSEHSFSGRAESRTFWSQKTLTPKPGTKGLDNTKCTDDLSICSEKRPSVLDDPQIMKDMQEAPLFPEDYDETLSGKPFSFPSATSVPYSVHYGGEESLLKYELVVSVMLPNEFKRGVSYGIRTETNLPNFALVKSTQPRSPSSVDTFKDFMVQRTFRGVPC